MPVFTSKAQEWKVSDDQLQKAFFFSALASKGCSETSVEQK